MIVVDYTTKFFKIHSLLDKQLTTIIHLLKSIFTKFGVLQIVMNDGSPKFKSDAFKKFAQNWDFQRDRSSALYTQSNVLMEWIIQTVKHTMKNVMRSSQNPYLALLALRTNLLIDAPAPATQLMGQRLYTILLYIDHQYQNKQKDPPSSSARKLPELKPEISVCVLSDNKWEMKGRVFKELKYPCSYVVETEKGTQVRWNCYHLLKTKENITIQPDHDYENILPADNPPAGHQSQHLPPKSRTASHYTWLILADDLFHLHDTNNLPKLPLFYPLLFLSLSFCNKGNVTIIKNMRVDTPVTSNSIHFYLYMLRNKRVRYRLPCLLSKCIKSSHD